MQEPRRGRGMVLLTWTMAARVVVTSTRELWCPWKSRSAQREGAAPVLRFGAALAGDRARASSAEHVHDHAFADTAGGDGDARGAVEGDDRVQHLDTGRQHLGTRRLDAVAVGNARGGVVGEDAERFVQIVEGDLIGLLVQ